MGTFEKNKGYRTKLGTLDGLKLAIEREVMASGCHMLEKKKIGSFNPDFVESFLRTEIILKIYYIDHFY